jgi:hypothetical protein
MKYIRFYIKNFGLVNRVVWLAFVINLWFLFINNKRLIKYIVNHNDKALPINESDFDSTDFLRINKIINKIINHLPFYKSCLIKSIIVTRFIYRKYGYSFPIKLGVNFIDYKMNAHSWIAFKPLFLKSKEFIVVN